MSSSRSASPQAVAGDLEQTVAGGVAEGVVDALEVVEVEEGDDGGHARFRVSAIRARSSERLGRPVSESWKASRRR